MSFADPNLAYFLLMLALWGIVFSVYKPGTAIFEPMALIAAVATIISLVPQPTNWVAAVIVSLGVLVFLLVPLIKRDPILLAVAGVLAQIMGGVFLFNGPPVSPILIGVGVVFSLGIFQFVLMPILRKQVQEPIVGDEQLLTGATGYVVKPLDPIGTVNIRGELWTAFSNQSIAAGETVIVMGKEGLRLFVEKSKPKHRPAEGQD